LGGAAVEFERVRKVFGAGAQEVVALRDVSLAIPENAFFTLLGPSGCGKTTLLRLVAGFEEPTSGRVLLHGRSIEGLPPHRRPVNTVFQSYALFPHMSVRQNIAFGLEMMRVPRREADGRVAEMLALVKLAGMEHRRPAELSGGQQQRVALARALASRPQVLLLDEPLSALDLKLRKEMQVELKRLQAETRVTFVFVTHDQEEALTMSDRLAVMDHGEVLQVGTPREIYDHPVRRFVADFIGETNFLPAVAEAGGALRVDGLLLPAAAEAPAGRDVTIAVRPERARLAPPSEGRLAGRLETVVYMGTDTLYHLRLASGGLFKVRVQNAGPGGGQGLAPGDAVGLELPPTAIQVLAD
jgi:spermidine/putrescine transport system ATP-binding protein